MLKTFWEGKRGTNACGNGKYSHSENEFLSTFPQYEMDMSLQLQQQEFVHPQSASSQRKSKATVYHFNEMLKERGRFTS